MGTKTTPSPVIDTTHHQASTVWIPRAVRCSHCGAIAQESIRERVSDDEVVVRYACDACSGKQTRRYHESDLGH